MTLKEILTQRSAYYDYDSNEKMSDDIIEQLVSQAILAPTVYYMQNVKFIAITTDLQKGNLCQVAFHQQKIKAAPVTFIICGNELGYQTLASNLKPALEAGQINQDFADNLVKGATNSHHANAQLRRDEAIRSASLASMVLMLSAEDMGYATGAMSGFEPNKLQEAFNLP